MNPFFDNIKLVATDIGGTLARSDGSISDFTVETLRTLQERGIIIVLATGYSKEITDKFASQICDKLITIIQNGAIVFDGEALLETNYLNKDIALKVVEFFESKGFSPILFSGLDNNCKTYYKRMNKRFSPRKSYIEVSDLNNVLKTDPVEVSAWEATEDILTCKEEAEELFGEEWHVTVSIQKNRSWLEVLNPNAKKANALLSIMKRKGIGVDEAIYFGDNYNDVECLEAVKYPIVVSNGLPDVKKLAWKIALSNDEDGVALMIRKLLSLNDNNP